MKKFLLITAALFMGAIGFVKAQTIENSRFTDNWSVGIKGGAVTPLNHAAFWGDMRGVVGLELRKNITPVWGLGIEGQWSVNTSSWSRFMHSTTAFDHQMVGVFGTFNFNNAFAGYKGSPRLCEVELNAGTGWLHGYINNHKELNELYGNSFNNSWYTKVGANVNFNLGKAKAWTLSLQPAFVYNMDYPNSTGYNINHGYFEILAGVSYHFKNHNGTHSFKLCDKKYTQTEWDNLMAEVNELRAREPQVIEKIVEVQVEKYIPVDNVITNNVIINNSTLENAVGFKLNSAVVEPTEYANIANVAEWLRLNPDEDLYVIGYASRTYGTPQYNEKLSLERAQAVKDVLVNTFNIDPDRLLVHGEGDSLQPYTMNDSWNQVVLFKVSK